jgi:hypothetical protein
MDSVIEQLQTVLSERRAGERFGIERPVRYRFLDANYGHGEGATLDISRRGMCFTTGVEAPLGLRVQVSVDWPVALEDKVPLQLVARGRVVWSEDGRSGMIIEKYEFRTRSKLN